MYRSSILIVDDEPINLQIAAESLVHEYNIFVSRSGEEALEFMQKQHVDLVLLDINMTGIDGFATARQMVHIELNADTPVIYLTADTSEDTIAQAFDSGAADYITKPIRKKELLSRVKNHIETENLKKEQNRLIRKNQHLVDIIKTHIAYIKTDIHGTITEASLNFCELVESNIKENDASCEKFVGQNINILKSGYTHQNVYKKLWETIEKGETYTHDIENRNFNGGTNWYRVTVTPDIGPDGIVGYVAFYNNIDDQIRFEHDANTDFLTGLNNRAKFEKTLVREIARTIRYQSPLSVILIDIDHFKHVNDDYGHVIGDAVLKEFAHILSLNIRESDTLARWGGEEFVVLCPHTNLNGATVMAEALRSKIEAYNFDTIGHKTASFGVAQYNPDKEKESIVLDVDAALYVAKQEGRNKVVVFKD